MDTRTVPLTLTDPDGTEFTVSPRNEQLRVLVDAGSGRRAAAYLDGPAVDALAEHLMHRDGRDAAIDRHIQGLRTVAIRHGYTPHLLAAIEHLVEDLRQRVTSAVPAETVVETTRPWTPAERAELAAMQGDPSERDVRRRAVELGMLQESAWVLPLGQVSAYVVERTPAVPVSTGMRVA